MKPCKLPVFVSSCDLVAPDKGMRMKRVNFALVLFDLEPAEGTESSHVKLLHVFSLSVDVQLEFK
jgi:hypothetical protein